MSHNMQTLLSTAAELRSGGHSWESVASQVHRSIKTVRQWPNRFEVQWTLLFQKAQQKRQTEAAAEALHCLRHLLQEEDLRIRVKAADSLLKLTPSPQGQAEMSEREMEVREALEKIEGAVDWFTPRVQAERQKQGLAPLSGKELEHACFHAFHQQLYEMHLSTGEYQALQHYRQQQKHESKNTEPEDDSTHPIPSIHPLILLWLLVSTLLSGVSAVREFQRQSISQPERIVWQEDSVGLALSPVNGARPSQKVSESLKYSPEAAFDQYVFASSQGQPRCREPSDTDERADQVAQQPTLTIPLSSSPESIVPTQVEVHPQAPTQLSIPLVGHLEPLLYFGIDITDFG